MHRTRLTMPVLAIPMLHLLTIAGWCQSLPGELNLSRRQAIEMAISRNIEVRNESLSTQIAQIEAFRSRSLYNPVLRFSAESGITSFPGETFGTRNTAASMGLNQYLPTGGSLSATSQTGYTTAISDNPELSTRDWQSSLGLNVNQPLLRNAWRETTEFSLFLADTNLTDARERFRSTIIETVFSVVTAYNRLYTLRQVLQSRKAALESAERFQEEIRQRAATENSSAMDLADADFAVVQRRKELVEIERNVRDQEAGVRYVIGLEEKTTIIPVDPPSREEPLETEEQAVLAALNYRPELQLLQTSLQVAQVQERIARRQVMPELNLTASGGVSGTGETISDNWQEMVDGRRRFWTVGMQFSYPLGNTAAINDYQRTKVRTEQLQNQFKALSWRIRNDVESDMRALISARLQVRMADHSLKIAQQRLDEYRKNHQAGTSTVQDVIDAERDLIQARNAQADAVETFANAVARLRRDTGTLLDHQGVVINLQHPGK